MSAAGAKRTVMIAIDGSKQAEQAFDCEYSLFSISFFLGSPLSIFKHLYHFI